MTAVEATHIAGFGQLPPQGNQELCQQSVCTGRPHHQRKR